jgi:membrane protease YdiL (CAAX protease family)
MWAPRRDIPALIFALVFPALFTWLYVVGFGSGHGTTSAGNWAVQVAYSTGKLVQFGFPIAYVAYFERDRLRLVRPSLRGLAFGFGFGALVGLLMLGLFFGSLNRSAAFAETPAKVWRLLENFGFATPGRFLLLAAFYAVGHSLLEEYYWRWFVFGWLRRYVPLVAAIALSALGFMAHHVVLLGTYFPGKFWTLALPLSLAVAIGGAVWAWIYHYTGSLYAAWLSHAIVDAAIFAIGYALLLPYWQSL